MHLKLKFIPLYFILTSPSLALDINLNPEAGMDQNAIDAFQRAADYWEGVLADDATVNINIGFNALDPGVLGSAGSTRTVHRISNYFTNLTNDATTLNDATAIANLPNITNGLDHLTQVDTEAGSTVVSQDNDNSNNNNFLAINTANAKALGLIAAHDPATDANINFSSSFSWDFDNSDGVDAGKQDFVGVAIHEIGHSLGFTSGVDTVDGQIGGADLDPFAIYSALDMFRYSAPGVINLGAGEVSYFSIDGGTTNLALFSTGRTHGDGQQASHWKDNLGLGIFDPTAQPAGNVNEVTALDLQSLDTIGWDLRAVPEPSSVMMLGGGLLLLLRRRSR